MWEGRQCVTEKFNALHALIVIVYDRRVVVQEVELQQEQIQKILKFIILIIDLSSEDSAMQKEQTQQQKRCQIRTSKIQLRF